MILVLVTLAGAVLAGLALGGRIGNLAHVRIAVGWIVMVAVGFQLALAAVSAAGGPVGVVGLPLLLASHAALLIFLWRNRLLPGMPLIFLGFAMNMLVIAVNGAMPVSREALAIVSRGANGVIPPGKHRFLEQGDILTFLADIHPVPVLRTVVSLGDIVMGAGVAVLVVALMRRAPKAPVPAGDAHQED